MNTLVVIAREFSPRYEQHRDDLVSIDVSGLERLVGPPRTIGEELRRDAAARGVIVHVALARTRSAALVLALARPGLTVIDAGRERDALAPLPIAILEKAYGALSLEPLKCWGIRTLGEFAALPSAALAARLGQSALRWQAIARGEDAAPLVPTLPGERFESSLELEWPIEDLEPLSFVLMRLLEPLSARLERRDRGAAILHLELRLVTKAADARRLQLPSPIRDARTLRTLLLLDLESHPPPAAIDRVTIAIDPTPGRVVQHTLFARARPTPEQLSTLVARLGALMGQDRIGAPATIDSHRPGVFAMEPFATEHEDHHDHRRARRERTAASRLRSSFSSTSSGEARRSASGAKAAAVNVVSALRRCRHPVPARAVIAEGRPLRMTTDRCGFAGGAVVMAAGPWRTSGNWWAGRAGGAWDRDEWDVGLGDGAVYRIFRDRATDTWFVDAIAD